VKGLIAPPVALVVLASIGCAKPKPVFEKIGPGMTEEEVIKKLGKPSSMAMQGQTKYLEYESWDIDPWWGNRINHQVFFVRIINGKVESFGRKGDFDSTKNPTKDININQKIETTDKSPQTSSNANKFDLEAELAKLNKMKTDGLITEDEYKQLRQRAIDKAKVQ
jgi:hypothetical protein